MEDQIKTIATKFDDNKRSYYRSFTDMNARVEKIEIVIKGDY